MTKREEEDVRTVAGDYDIWGKFTEVYKLIGKARNMELSTIGLSPEQSHILRILTYKGGSSTINDLSDLTLTRHNTVSLLVKRMEKLGLVRREKIGSTRQYRITISDKGSELFNTMPINSIEMAFSSLSIEEKKSLEVCLNQLSQKTRHILGLDYIPPLFR